MSDFNNPIENPELDEYDILKVIRELTETLSKREVTGVDVTLNKAYDVVIKTHDKLNLGNVIFLKGTLASINSQFKLAIQYYNQSLSIFEELGDLKRIVDTALKIGSIQGDIGNINDALKTYYFALEKMNESGKFLATKASIKNNIGLLYQNMYDYDNALKFYHESYKIFKNQKMKYAIPIITYNLASTYFFMDEFESSQKFVNKSLSSAKELDSELDYLFSEIIDDVLKYRLNKNEDVFLLQCEYIFKRIEELGDLRDLTDLFKWFAKAMFSLGEFEKAKVSLEEIYPLLLKSDLASISVDVGELLEKVYVELGDYRSAYNISKEVKAIRDEEVSSDESNMKDMVDYYESLDDKGYVANLKNNLRIVKLLSKVGEGITYNRDITSIFNYIIDQLYDIWEMDVFGLGVISEDNTRLEYHYHTRDEGTKIGELELRNKGVLMNHCVLNEEEIIIQDSRLMENYKDMFNSELVNIIYEGQIRSIIFLPLTTDKGVIGGITIQSKISEYFRSQDLEDLRILASYCSAAVSNYKRHLKLIKIKDFDGLTEVYNRHALINRNSLIEDNPNDTKLPMFIAMFDIDYFKLFNDNYGHLAGDKCLIDVSAAVNKMVTSYGGKMYRYGGDEFVIIIENMDLEKGKQFLDQLMDKIHEIKIPHEYHKSSNQVTLSIGAIIINSFDYDVMEDYYKEIDELLYEVKKQGRDGYII